jgi:hypothetical protein
MPSTLDELELAEQFQADRYLVLPAFFPTPWRLFAYQYLLKQAALGKLSSGDPSLPIPLVPMAIQLLNCF